MVKVNREILCQSFAVPPAKPGDEWLKYHGITPKLTDLELPWRHELLISCTFVWDTFEQGFWHNFDLKKNSLKM